MNKGTNNKTFQLFIEITPVYRDLETETPFQAFKGFYSFITHLVLCFGCVFLMLKLLFQLLLEDLQSLVLQMKLLRLGDLSERTLDQKRLSCHYAVNGYKTTWMEKSHIWHFN